MKVRLILSKDPFHEAFLCSVQRVPLLLSTPKVGGGGGGGGGLFGSDGEDETSKSLTKVTPKTTPSATSSMTQDQKAALRQVMGGSF